MNNFKTKRTIQSNIARLSLLITLSFISTLTVSSHAESTIESSTNKTHQTLYINHRKKCTNLSQSSAYKSHARQCYKKLAAMAPKHKEIRMKDQKNSSLDQQFLVLASLQAQRESQASSQLPNTTASMKPVKIASAPRTDRYKKKKSKQVTEKKKTSKTSQELQQARLEAYQQKLFIQTSKHVDYPKLSITRGHEGTVRLQLVINKQGKLKHVSTLESAKHKRLNQAALAAVNLAAPFPEVPDWMQMDEFSFSVPIVFRLN